MVALNSDFAASKTDIDTKNRVGRFFSLAAESIGEDRRSSRKCAGEKRGYRYDTTSVDTAFEYGPFGELIRATGEKKDDFNFRFSTKYQDAETELLYYGYRYYNPKTGRWLNKDPLGERGGLNLYGMVGNNTVNYFDLLGLVDSFEILGNITDTIDACSENYPIIVPQLEDILNDFVNSDRRIKRALNALQESAAKIKAPFQGDEIILPDVRLDIVDQLKAAQFIGEIFGDDLISYGENGQLIASVLNGTGAVIEPVEFGFDALGKISDFVDLAEAPFSSNKAGLSALTTIATITDKFGGAAGPIGKYYSEAIKGIDRALSKTGRVIAINRVLPELRILCDCTSGKPDYLRYKKDFDRQLNRLREGLK